MTTKVPDYLDPKNCSGLAQNRYSQLWSAREPYLIRARRQASLTCPSLFRMWGANDTTETPATWQSFGARCVNNLSSKLALSMFPPGIPFMRQRPSRQAIADLQKLNDPDQAGKVKTAISQGLSKVDQEFTNMVDEDGDFTNHTSALKHLVVGGNHALWMYHDGSLRDLNLEKYCNLRDKAGNLLEYVIEDQMAYETLPPDIQMICQGRGYKTDPTEAAKNGQTIIRLYTRGYRTEGKWHVNQEVYGYEVPNSHWIYEDDVQPFMPLTLNLLPGENYGRSYVEEYEADLQTLDGLEQTIAEGSSAAALYIRMVKPGGVTSKKALAQALNGDVITGNPEDVSVVDNTKAVANFQSAEKGIDRKMEMLSMAFLLNSAVQRDAERVTAEEIRYVAQELQDALGGVYSNQIKTYQRPYGLRKFAAGQRTGRITQLPKASVKPVVVTGAAALSQNAALQALDSLIPPATSPMAQIAAQVVKPGVWFAQRATALSLDSDGLLLSQDELDAMQQQAQQQQQLQEATPALIQQGGNLAKAAMGHGAQAALQQQQATQQQQAATQQQPSQPQGQ